MARRPSAATLKSLGVGYAAQKFELVHPSSEPAKSIHAKISPVTISGGPIMRAQSISGVAHGLPNGTALAADSNRIRSAAWGSISALFDNDGREDVFLTALSNEGFDLVRNIGTDGFLDLTQATLVSRASLRLSGWSAGIYNFDNDGSKDLFTDIERSASLDSRQFLSVFANRCDGRFEYSAIADKALYRGAAFRDLDGDGKIDAVVTRLNQPPLVLHNITETANHWLRLRLRGHRSNRDGIGARIRIATNSGEQWSHATASVGYAGSSEREIHFGLGSSAVVNSIEILWPSGARQELRGVKADRLLDVEEE